MSNCLGHEHYLSHREVAVWIKGPDGDPRAARAWRLPPADVMIGDVRGWSEATIREWLAGSSKLTAPRDPWVPPCIRAIDTPPT